jgi:hypothetical protein
MHVSLAFMALVSSVPVIRGLYGRPGRRSKCGDFTAEYDGNPSHRLPTNQADFYASLVRWTATTDCGARDISPTLLLAIKASRQLASGHPLLHLWPRPELCRDVGAFERAGKGPASIGGTKWT